MGLQASFVPHLSQYSIIKDMFSVKCVTALAQFPIMRVLFLITVVHAFVPQKSVRKLGWSVSTLNQEEANKRSPLFAVQDPMAELAAQWAATNSDKSPSNGASAPSPQASSSGATMDDLAKQWAAMNADSDSASTNPSTVSIPAPVPPSPTTMNDLAAMKSSPSAPAPSASVSMDELAAQWAARNADTDASSTATSARINGSMPAAPPAVAPQSTSSASVPSRAAAPSRAPVASKPPTKTAAKAASPTKSSPAPMNPAYRTKVIVEPRGVQREKKKEHNRTAIDEAGGARRTLVRGVVGTGFAAAMGKLATPYLDQQPQPFTEEELAAIKARKPTPRKAPLDFDQFPKPFTAEEIAAINAKKRTPIASPLDRLNFNPSSNPPEGGNPQV